MYFHYIPKLSGWIICDSDDIETKWKYSRYTISELYENLNEIVYNEAKNKSLRNAITEKIKKMFIGQTFEYYDSRNRDILLERVDYLPVLLDLLFALKFGVDEDTDSHVYVAINDNERYLRPISVPRFEQYVQKPADAIEYYRRYEKYLSDGMKESVLSRIEELLNEPEVNK